MICDGSDSMRPSMPPLVCMMIWQARRKREPGFEMRANRGAIGVVDY